MPLLYGGRTRTGGSQTPYPGFDDMFKDYGAGAGASLEDLHKKYMEMVPDINITTDPHELYENIMGPARGDVSRATEQIGLGLQARATGGASYEDMLSRYLPEAVKPLADVASRAGAAGQQFAQAGEVARTQAEQANFRAASEMAIAEKSIMEEGRRFMLDLKARIQMAEREIRAKERIALQQARSAEHIARIRANAQREVARIQANAQMEATRFAQEQENYRNNVRMQVYDKYFTGQLAGQERRDMLRSTEFLSKFGGGEGETGEITDPGEFADRFGNLTPHEIRMGRGVGAPTRKPWQSYYRFDPKTKTGTLDKSFFDRFTSPGMRQWATEYYNKWFR